MFRVMIVDDEPLVRLALGAIIPWDDLECEVVAEAADGYEAWERISAKQDIDIMIADMSMPVMDANTLLSKLQEANLRNAPQSIVLSAYSDFDFVRKAFLLGAVDYIMKANLDPEHIIPVIQKAVNKLKEKTVSSARTNSYSDSDSKQRETWLRGLLREKDYLYNLNLTLDDSFHTWVSQYANQQHVIVSLLPDERLDNDVHLVKIIRQGMEIVKVPFELIQIQEDELSLLLCFESRVSYLNIRERVMEILDSLRNTVKNFLNITLSVGVGGTCTDWKSWHQRYIQAKYLASLRFSEGLGRVYYPEVINADEKPHRTAWDHTVMMQLMNKGDSKWQQLLNAGLKQLSDVPNVTLESALPIYEELIWNIGALLHAKAMNWTHVIETRRRPYEIVEQFMFREDLHEWIEQLVFRLADLLHSEKQREDNPQRLVERVKRYVEQNYCKPITLGQVSEWAQVTESHLSKQFVKETGEHFIEYVTKLRINEAARLIESEMKMYEIAVKVGYENPEHFSRVFKKYRGMSPQKYRDDDARKKI
ncbi:Protein-glutamate methylesterase/protein-glutamine glutaminase [Paenibacillus allorhizoplanae]|uniref:Protein-glutamate methylesterase/protein-glutamine glutaminase n=1 Tax=Paenibacillus allorhizoplanae TaxID=2905648 RepID=A0ABN8HA20_9BACL|nr:helix-turn-helix domain-containing protein [Paenibacillus allorhizoplanae]CAH1231106.1 Protein-glutamate methylesterase/protein-glutamine glutaminase [Paenibacillus allorhizoplanae]